MYAKPPKKLLIMNILDILRKYTDENHRLGQNEIVEILERAPFVCQFHVSAKPPYPPMHSMAATARSISGSITSLP